MNAKKMAGVFVNVKRLCRSCTWLDCSDPLQLALLLLLLWLLLLRHFYLCLAFYVDERAVVATLVWPLPVAGSARAVILET